MHEALCLALKHLLAGWIYSFIILQLLSSLSAGSNQPLKTFQTIELTDSSDTAGPDGMSELKQPFQITIQSLNWNQTFWGVFIVHFSKEVEKAVSKHLGVMKGVELPAIKKYYFHSSLKNAFNPEMLMSVGINVVATLVEKQVIYSFQKRMVIDVGYNTCNSMNSRVIKSLAPVHKKLIYFAM